MSYDKDLLDELFLLNDFKVDIIDLSEKKCLQVLVIENCPNLERILLPKNDNLQIFINNCENLSFISNSFDTEDNTIFANSIYLGVGLPQLQDIKLINFNSIITEEQDFRLLKSLYLQNIKNLSWKFNNCKDLYIFHIESCKTENVTLDSDSLTSININNVETNKVEINGNNKKLTDFVFRDNKYDSLYIKYSLLHMNSLDLSDNSNIVPFLPLSSDNYYGLITLCYISKNTILDSKYKSFYKQNSSYFEFRDNFTSKLINIDDIIFLNRE